MNDLIALLMELLHWTKLSSPLLPVSIKSTTISGGGFPAQHIYENNNPYPVKVAVQNQSPAGVNQEFAISGYPMTALNQGRVLDRYETRELIVPPGGRVFTWAPAATNVATLIQY